MKSINAIKKIETELEVKVYPVKVGKFATRMAASYKGNFLTFFTTSNGDAENFEVSKDLQSNGIFPSNIQEALKLMR